MTDEKHISELIETVTEQIEITDKLPLYPKNKLVLYQQYALSKISWHLTVVNISNKWMKNIIYNIVSRHIKQWV